MEERLNALLKLALKQKATDIHFSRQQKDFKVEMRINGIMYKVKPDIRDESLMKYLQYLSNLDVGNIKKPQTGQFEWIIDDIPLSLRFAVINAMHMESGVLRILNNALKLDIDSLSISKAQTNFFKSMINHKNGIYLCSGPTGSV